MEISYNRALHRYATLVACATFLLIIAGALVTSNDAALSIPSWPAPLYWPAAMGPGGKFELSHRVVAGTVSLLTLILALWLWRADPRRWVRRLGAVAVGAVLAQAALGGITVLFDLPVAISVSHACLGQIFFCIAVSLALFTSADWRWDEPKQQDERSLSLRALAAATTAAIFMQLALGAAFRHKGFGILPHLIGAVVVTVGVLWLAFRVLMEHRQEIGLVRPTAILSLLVVLQVILGISSYLLRLASVDAPQPLLPVVVVTTAHVAMGALVLASSLIVTFQAYRFVAPRAHSTAWEATHQET
jgi:heme a synthase